MNTDGRHQNCLLSRSRSKLPAEETETLNRRRLADNVVFWLRNEERRFLAPLQGNPSNSKMLQELLQGGRVFRRRVRVAVESGDFHGALSLFGNASDVGFRFVEAALPLVPRSGRPSFVEHAWVHGQFGEHAYGHGGRVSGADLVRRTNRIFRQVPELQPRLGPVVVAYRGVSDVNPAEGALHPSWSMRRDVAAWFATRCPGTTGYVLVAEFPAAAVLALFDSRDESEIVVDAFAVEELTVTAVTTEDRFTAAALQQARKEGQQAPARTA